MKRRIYFIYALILVVSLTGCSVLSGSDSGSVWQTDTEASAAQSRQNLVETTQYEAAENTALQDTDATEETTFRIPEDNTTEQIAVDDTEESSEQRSVEFTVGSTVNEDSGFVDDTEKTTKGPEKTEAPTITENQDDEDFDMHYILNKNTKKFHYPDCPSVKQMSAKNKKEYYGSRDDIIDMGYKPCQRCNP